MSQLAALLPPDIAPLTAALLIVISFVTSAITAAFGIGGGVAMLGALAGTVPPGVVIAVHGLVQFGSNVGRAVVQRQHAQWPLVWRFVAGSALGIAAGALLFRELPEQWLLAMLGLFILLVTWVPKPELPGLSRAGMVAGGAVSSVLTMFVGATGPFIHTILLPLKLERKAQLATHAVMMAAQHLMKVAGFLVIGVGLVAWLPLIAVMIAAGFLGTLVGSALLEKLPETAFQWVLKALLTVLALDLLRRAAGLTFGAG